jgi:hypothetical protein
MTASLLLPLIQSSIDGGLSWLTCTNGQPIPQLVAGLATSGMTLQIRKTATQNANPDALLQITGLQCVIQSSYAASFSTVSKSYGSADFPGGTNSNTTTSNGNLTIIGQLRPYSSTSDYNGQTTPFGSAFNYGIYKNSLYFTYDAGVTGASFLRLDGVGNNWQNFTAEVDVYIPTTNANDSSGLVYRTANFGSGAGAFAYRAMISQSSVVLAKGTNTSGGSTVTTLGSASLSLTSGSTHRLKVVVNGNSHQVYVDEVLLISVTDSTFTAAGYFALCYVASVNETNVNVYYAHFGVTASLTGTWTSTSLSLNSVGTYGSSYIVWDTGQTPDTTSIGVNISTNGGSTWTACTNGAALPVFTAGQSLSGVNAQFQVVLTSNNASAFPSLAGLTVIVQGPYSASGTRTTAPLAIDTMVRASQFGFGTSFDGQTYTKTGFGFDAIAGNEATITNTAGDVHEQIGSTTGTDLDGTVRFQLSASTIVAGMELRYDDANNFYRLSASTTALTLSKHVAGTNLPIATATVNLIPGMWYWLRFRIVGSTPVQLFGKVWKDGTGEPGILTPATPQWTVAAND